MERNDREQDNERKVGLLYAAALTGRLSRREVLKRGAALGVSASALAALLAACGGGSAPAPTSTAGGSAAAGGNTASGTPTKAAAAGSPAASGAAKPVLGADLVGKLEGAEVITDPAQIPKSFKEAPQLADLVKAGKLPPVEQRVSQEPMVVKPLNEIGKYGGTWRRAFTGPGDGENGNRINSTDKVLFWDYTGNKIIPSLAKGWELSANGTSCKLLLRKGARWSDGEPFNADDFVFWFQDVYQNKDLLPAGTSEFLINGKPGTLNKIDDYTVEYKFPEAYPAIVEVLAGSTDLGGGHASRGDGLMGSYAPAHYLKQFHPKYVGQDKVDQMAKDAKYDNWVLFFKFKNNWRLNTELPVMCPWKTTAPINTTTWVLERNPFYWAVDTAGNQLPYIDKISMSNAESIEVVGLRGIAGQIDYQARNMELTKLPVFLQNQKQGDYTVHLDPGLVGTDGAFYFNQSYDGDAEIAKWLTNKDFRNAFSLGIDRDQMNEAFWLGLGTPGSPIPEDSSPYNPGPEWRTKWHVKDIKQANDLLDKAGLTKKDSEGYRLRTDNGQRLRLQVMTISGSFLDFGQVGEMVTQHVKQIGLQLDISVLERTLGTTNAQGNKHQIFLWTCDGTEKLSLWPRFTLPLSDPGAYLGPLFSSWYASGGKVGKQPTDPQLLKAIDLFQSSFGKPTDERYKLCQEVWKIAVDQCWTVGTVGLSPAVMGVRIVKNYVGNAPSRQANGQAVRTPCSSQPTTFYFKS